MLFRRIVAALCVLAVASTAQAQPYRPGFSPGFRSGFSFVGQGLAPIALTNTVAVAQARVGDAVAYVTGLTPGATTSLTGGGGALSISGEVIRAASTLSAGSISFNVVQTKAGVPAQTTPFVITVAAGLSGTTFDRSRLGTLQFEDTFTSYPDIYHPTQNPNGKYATFYQIGSTASEADTWANPSQRTLSYANQSGNHEGQTYVDPAWAGIDPFRVVSGGGLEISATPTPAAKLAEYGNRPVVSGMLRTRGFAPTYGYAEARILTENKPGYWAAHWLYEKTGKNGAELDVIEAGQIFNQPSGTYAFQNTHGAPDGNIGAFTILSTRPDQAFHTYAVKWESDTIAYYIDGVQTVTPFATPSAINDPMQLLLNLAVGWFTGDDTISDAYDPAQLPYRMRVDYQRFYTLLPPPAPPTPTFPLDFTTGTMPANVSFSRASAAYAENAAGTTLTRFAADVPALTDKGILLEPAGSNLAASPEDISGATKTNTTVTADATTGPSGSPTADPIVENTANGVHIIRRFLALSPSSPYRVSLYAKRGAGARNLRASIENADVTFNLANGTIGQTASGSGHAIAAKANGYYRTEIQLNTAATPTNLFDLYLATGTTNAGSSVVYVGDGTSSLIATGIQIETGTKATSYMGPEGARAAANLSFTLPAGKTSISITLDDNSVQIFNGLTPGSTFTVPVSSLNRPNVKTIN